MEKTVSIKWCFPKKKQPQWLVRKMHEPLIKKEVEETNPDLIFTFFQSILS